ncbi:MAG TPA: acyl-[acyl-carrier-protein]--UDP-N-acetylglucosamine O-acyltransferase [Gammaproteobacteria bacterium]|nr:acyl-[acyl-carrier-protein]--UDP-N-acetylglucosamine O-acyltransferase [Gammaproteobacteria bacterium]
MIDENAVIDPGVRLGSGVSVGPFTVIGPGVEIGDGAQIASHVVIKGPTRLGAGVKIYQFASVGEDTSALAYEGEDSSLTVGDHTVIREGVTIHRGMDKGGIGRTEVGSHCLFMAYAHVAHDCIVGDHVIMANASLLAGHVEVGDYANIGGAVGVAQYRKIGAYSHLAALSLITKDVPAYLTVGGNPARVVGLNKEGMRRRGFSAEVSRALEEAYRIVLRRGLRTQDALAELTELREQYAEVDLFARTVETSDRGIMRVRRRGTSA